MSMYDFNRAFSLSCMLQTKLLDTIIQLLQCFFFQAKMVKHYAD